MSKVQDDSFWYIEKTEPYEDSRIRAMCIECGRRLLEKEVMYWSGERGYGDYDLNCSMCGKIIHQRDVGEEIEK